MVRRHPLVLPDRVAVTGASQGGGITLAVSALVRDLWAVMPDVPFLCDFPRAVEVAETDPYVEVAHFLRVHRDKVGAAFSTLAYFDAAALGRLATAPAMFSVGLKDQICPPSTVYGAYNLYGRAQADGGVPLQRPRRRPGLPAGGAVALAGRSLALYRPRQAADDTTFGHHEEGEGGDHGQGGEGQYGCGILTNRSSGTSPPLKAACSGPGH